VVAVGTGVRRYDEQGAAEPGASTLSVSHDSRPGVRRYDEQGAAEPGGIDPLGVTWPSPRRTPGPTAMRSVFANRPPTKFTQTLRPAPPAIRR